MTKEELQSQLRELSKLDLDECVSGMVVERAMNTIKRLRSEVAELEADVTDKTARWLQMLDVADEWCQRAEKAEAERDALATRIERREREWHERLRAATEYSEARALASEKIAYQIAEKTAVLMPAPIIELHGEEAVAAVKAILSEPAPPKEGSE